MGAEGRHTPRAAGLDSGGLPLRLNDRLGHSFAYVTDHIDLIRQGQGWAKYVEELRSYSHPLFTLAPGLEVTCRDRRGDALGYGMPVEDPAQIVNQQSDCAELVALIRGAGPDASACIAHPGGGTGPLPWAMPGCGYHGVQVVNGITGSNVKAEAFWVSSMVDHAETCAAAAVGGSDAHLTFEPLGMGTWIHAPEWFRARGWEGKVRAIARGLKEGRTVATREGSLAFFDMDGHLPGSRLTARAGTDLHYTVHFHPLRNAHQAHITWTVFRPRAKAREYTLVMEADNRERSIGSILTRVLPGTQSYYLRVTFEYCDGEWPVAEDWVLCGPIRVQGT